MHHQIKLFLLLILILSSCSIDTSNKFYPFEDSKKIIITGKIENYNPNEDDFFIKFGYNDLLDIQYSEDVEINDDGSFKYTYLNFFPSEYFFSFKRLIPFYAFPGDSIHFTFHNDSITGDESFPYSQMNFVHYSGKYHQMTEDYFEYIKYFYSEMYNWDGEQLKPQELDSTQYLNYITEIRANIYQAKVDSFISIENRSTFFKEWVAFELKYMAHEELLHYKTNHLGLRRYTYKDNFIPTNYHYILNKEEFNESKAICNNQYRSFIRSSEMYIVSHHLPIDSLEKVMKFYKTNRPLLFKTQKEMILAASDGIGKDLLLANFYSQLFEWKELKSFELFIDNLDINNSYIKDYILNRYNILTEYSTQKAPEEANIHSSIKQFQILDSIVSLYPNKVLYIDIWAPWCSPCMGGIEESKKIKYKFFDKDVVFVYLGYSCSKDSWMTSINEKGIKGEHFHLTINQCSELNNRFNITGIPRYIIINKKGEIINDNAPSPFFYEDLKKEFNKLLQE